MNEEHILGMLTDEEPLPLQTVPQNEDVKRRPEPSQKPGVQPGPAKPSLNQPNHRIPTDLRDRDERLLLQATGILRLLVTQQKLTNTSSWFSIHLPTTMNTNAYL